MRFNDFKVITEAKFNSKQEVIDHFVKQGKSAAAGASAWERGWRGHESKPKKPTGPVRSYHDDLDDKRYGETETNEDSDPCWKDYKQVGMKKKNGKKVPNCVPKESVAEAALGTAPKRPARPGSRPERGHATESRYKKVVEDYCDACDRPKADCICDTEDKLDEHKKGVRAHKYTKKPKGTIEQSRKYMNSPDRTVIGPQKIKQLEKELKEAAELVEGAKVDRMVKHITKSEKKLGHSKKEAENIAWATANKRGMLDNKNKKEESIEEQFCDNCGGSLAEAGKASRAICVSSKADSELGASQLASCKSQGLRARKGEKSHKIGKTRVSVGGKKIKGREYGGPLPDWSEE